MDEVEAVVDEAHAHKLPVVAHAHRPEEIRRGLAAGVDCFEHTGLAAAPEYPEDVIAAMRERTAQMSGPAVLDADDRGPASTYGTRATTPSASTTRAGTRGCRPRSSPTSSGRSRIPSASPTSS